jgi:hypothetical protein
MWPMGLLFSSPELKAPVSFSDHLLSVVCLSVKPLTDFAQIRVEKLHHQHGYRCNISLSLSLHSFSISLFALSSFVFVYSSVFLIFFSVSLYLFSFLFSSSLSHKSLCRVFQNLFIASENHIFNVLYVEKDLTFLNVFLIVRL